MLIHKWIYVLKFLLFGFVIFVLAACTKRIPEPSLPQLGSVNAPQIMIDAETGYNYVVIDVLIYNVAALPWPIRRNRTKALRLIGDEFAEMRARGEEPDIVLIQEGFRASMKELISRSGYPNWVRGPKTGDKAPDFSHRASEEFKKSRSFWKGERTGKVMDSGLYILSNWPILGKSTKPFFRYECAGFDCGANKGVMGVGIEVPGMPGHLEIINTHFNSRGSSTGVSEERSFEAQRLQLNVLDDEIDAYWTGEFPIIFGGDFNAKQANDILDYMDETPERKIEKPTVLVPYYCTQIDTSCEFNVPFVSETPWLETQDWQGWINGRRITINALLVDEMFDEPHPEAPTLGNYQTLSDHNGVRVRYRLSWKPESMIAAE